ncbi:MAG: hypothetical protein CSA34_05270 [Desulfobulbus propionicus]|nr:MAG: hypothetical protein CSA34_05270 [Desulfobulbus propionicus]
MTGNTPGKSAPPRRFWQLRSVRILFGVVLTGCLLILATPYGVRIFLENWLEKNGADAVSINRVRLNPFTGLAGLEGTDIKQGGSTVFSDANIFFNIGLKRLFRKEALLQHAVITDVLIDIEQYEDGSLRIASYTAPSGTETAAPEKPRQKADKAMAWMFNIALMELENVTVRFRRPDLETKLVIEQARLENFSTDGDRNNASLSLRGTLNDTPVTLELPQLKLLPEILIKGSIDIAGLALDDLAGALSPYLDSFSGKASLKGAVDLSLASSEEMQIRYDGDILLDKGNIGGKGWSTSGTVSWEGPASFTMQKDLMTVDVNGDLQALDATFDMSDPLIDIDNPDIRISGHTMVNIAEDLVVDSSASLRLAKTTYAMDILNTGTSETEWDGKVRVDIGKDVVIDVDGKLRAQGATFDMPDQHIDIDSPDIVIEGKNLIRVADEVLVESDAALTLTSATYAMDILKTGAGKTSWQGNVHLGTGTETQGLRLRVKGDLDMADPLYTMAVNNADMAAKDRRITWNGSVEYVAGSGADASSRIATNGTLLSEAASFTLPEVITLSQQALHFKGTSDIELGKDLKVNSNGNLSLGETSLDMAGLSIGDKELTWTGTVAYRLGEHQEITTDGQLTLESLFADLGKANVHLYEQSITAIAKGGVSISDRPRFTGTLSFDGKGLHVNQGENPLVKVKRLFIDNAKDNGKGGLYAAALNLEELIVPTSNLVPVQVNIPAVIIRDISSPELTSVSAGMLEVRSPRVRNKDKATLLAELDTLSASDIRVDNQLNLQVSTLTADNGVFLENDDQKPLATLTGAKASAISYSSQSGLICDTVTLDGAFARLLRKKQQQASKQKEVVVKESTPPSPLPIKIGKVHVTGESGFTFTDSSLQEPFTTTFIIKTLEVNDIDLNDTGHSFSYTLDGAFDKYSPLHVTGKSAPLAPQLYIEQEATLRNYSMMQVSPYSVEAIGTYFPSGSLDLSSTLKLAEGKINLQNTLIFRELTSKSINGELGAKLNNQLPVPLDLAITMLRNDKGVINLKVPLRGKPSHLRVGLSDIIVSTLSRAITAAVTPYLAYTVLGPAGALAYLGVKVGEKILDPNLPALEFQRGATKLDDNQIKILEKIGNTIKKEQDTTYTIWARVATWEISGLDSNADEADQQILQDTKLRAELFKLGNARSLAVKNYLQDQFHIDENRLMISNPGLLFGKNAKPRVEFMR